MKNIFLSIFILCATNVIAQTEVHPLDQQKQVEGITYFLPRTCLHIVLHAEKTTHFPGEYAAYAQRYLRINDAPQQQFETWELKSIELQPYGVADKDKGYTIKLKPKTSAPLVGLAPDGRLLSINTPAPQLPALKTSASRIIKERRQDAGRYKTQEILVAGSVSKMAELCANEIYDIRESRSALAKGQAEFMPKDGQQLQLMFDNLDKQEAGLMELFTGTTQLEECDLTLDFPCDTLLENILLCRFSTHLGLVDNDDLAGEPVYISLTSDTAEPAPKENTQNSIRYILPRLTNIRIFYKQNDIAEFNLPMAQFGQVTTLGSELFNKRFTTRITFSPINGGIVKVEGEE